MDEFREKSGTGNLPAQNMPCWNESMQPSKVDLVSAGIDSVLGPVQGSSHGSRSTENRRPDAPLDREIGRAMTDALTDILSTEKEPRQRRNVS